VNVCLYLIATLPTFDVGTAPTSRRFNVVVRFPPLREVGQNGETTTPKGPTIRSPPIVWNPPHLTFLSSLIHNVLLRNSYLIKCHQKSTQNFILKVHTVSKCIDNLSRLDTPKSVPGFPARDFPTPSKHSAFKSSRLIQKPEKTIDLAKANSKKLVCDFLVNQVSSV